MRGTGQSENKLSDSMTFSDHLEELRQRILNSIYSILISIFFSFLIIKPLNSKKDINGFMMRKLKNIEISIE